MKTIEQLQQRNWRHSDVPEWNVWYKSPSMPYNSYFNIRCYTACQFLIMVLPVILDKNIFSFIEIQKIEEWD